MSEKAKFISVPEAAKILGISRIAVFKKVKKGEISAIRIGRNWAIPANFKIPPSRHLFRKSTSLGVSRRGAGVSPAPKIFSPKKYHERTKKAFLGSKERKMRHSGQEKIFQKVDDTLNSMGWD